MLGTVWVLATALIIFGFAIQHGGVVFVSFSLAMVFTIFYLSGTYEVKRSRHIPKMVSEMVLARQGGKCAYPGCYERDYLQKHHKVSFAQGGSNEASNIQYLCPNHHAQAHDSGRRTVNYNKPVEVINYD